MFNMSLFFPDKQTPIHEGRKRIDITYVNMAQEGFFYWLSQHFTAMNIFIECKNYGNEVANPELDQLAGRFGPSRGQVGFLVCRQFENKELFWKRCIDTAKDQRGFIIPLDDDDLTELVAAITGEQSEGEFEFFKQRFDMLIR